MYAVSIYAVSYGHSIMIGSMQTDEAILGKKIDIISYHGIILVI